MPTDPPFPSEDQLGDYRLVRLLHETDDTLTYEACQISVDRAVALVVLKPHRYGDPLAVQAFHDELRAKAAVSHPRIATVYEVREEAGRLFYTREVVRGDDLVSLAEMGRHLPLERIWDLISTTCESFLYYESKGLHYDPLRGEALVLIQDEPYVANLATAEPVDRHQAFKASLPALRDHLWPLIEPKDAMLADVQNFFARMDPAHERYYTDWQDLQRTCNIARKITLAPRLATPADPAATQVTTMAKRPVRQGPMRYIALFALVIASGSLWWFHFRPSVRPVNNPLIPISAEGIAMAQFEITIHEYSQFLEKTLAHKAYDHLNQPVEKQDHVPKDWQIYYPQAQKNGLYRENPISLNAPVMGVDWWDAYAYAQWRGCRLPTSSEWEAVARGPENSVFPWGNEPDFTNANTGLDYANDASSGGSKDGANAWAAVDSMINDRSAYGIHGMAGNVSEWTATWHTDPDNPDRQVPVVKGASFLTKENLELSYERFRPPDKRSMDRGFRIVRDLEIP